MRPDTVADRRRRLRAGGLTVDLGARQAHVDDRLIELTALEFDLLAYLIERPGQVFSRDQLLRAVWRSTAEWQQPATVTEHIRRLRTKIETEPHHPRILRTVRGAGYRLDSLEQRSAGFDTTNVLAPGTLVHIDGRIVQADQAAAAMFELDDQTPLIGRQISELWSPAWPAATSGHIVTCPGPERLTELIDVEHVDSTISLEFASKHVDWHGTRAQQVVAAWRCTVRAEPVVRRGAGSAGAAVTDEDTGYRALFERAADAVLVADDDGAYVDANPAAVRMLGVDRDDLLGRRVADFVVDDVAAVEHHWSTFVASDGESGRIRIRRGDGRVIVCDYNATANFVPGRHLSILRDVTEMLEAQQRREQSEHRFRRMLDALDLFALVTDVDGCATFMNRSMLKRLGVEPSQVMGERFALRQPDGEVQHQAFLSAVAAGEIAPEWENEILVAGGSTCRVRWSSAFIRDEQGRIEAVASIGEDITVRHRLEGQVRHAVRIESLGRLAGGVAHDFNNFLTVVRGHAELLAQAPELADSSSDHLDRIITGIDGAARLTRQLLAYGRQQIMEPRDVSVGDVIQRLRELLAPMLGRSVTIEIVQRTEADVVFIDPDQLDQVLVNLAVNARDAMPDGGVLRFEVSTSDIDEPMGALLGMVAGQYVTLSVNDTGDGIPNHLLEHVFEPFVTTKSVGEGTGLGLSIAYGIIAQSGGMISVDSQLGHGATFTIRLPLVIITASSVVG